jgi:formate-dependent nitrite reductase membrane component NrfD
MAEEFIVDYKLNEGFDSLVALNITIEGSGAALLVASVLMRYFAGVVAGMALVMLGILFLFFHLGNRFKFWRVIVGLKKAWISRGAFFASGLVFFGILFFLFNGGMPGLAVQIGTAIFGLLVILYSGFLLSSMKPIPFWNSPLTPVLFLLHSTTTGMAILVSMLALAQSAGAVPGRGLIGFMVCLVAVTLLFTIIHVMVMANAMDAARESVRRLMSDGLKWSFLGGAITLGMIVPLIIFGYMYLSLGQPVQNLTIMLFVAVVLRIVGDYAFRSSVLSAGVFEKMI